MSYLSSSAAALVRNDRNHASGIRAAVSSRSYLQRTEAILAAGGVTAPPPPVPPPPGAQELRDVRSLPVPLQEPVAGLEAAVRRAIDELGPMPPADVISGLRALIRNAAAVRPSRATSIGKPAAAEPRLPTGAGSRSIAHAEAADPAATLMMAAALDRYLPALRAAAPSAPDRSGTAGTPCDLANQAPILCVSSNANKADDIDAALTVDLGGDTTYTGAVAGAPFIVANGSEVVPVSIIVSLGGDDNFVPTPDHTVTGFTVGAGAGFFGGIGIVAKSGGANTFTAGGSPYVLAEGAGIAGVGLVFADETTSNTLTATTPSQQGSGSTVFAQAFADGCGADPNLVPPTGSCAAGSVITTGGGDNTYMIRTGDISNDESRSQAGAPVICGQACALVGAAVLADDGNNDSYTIDASDSDGAAPAAQEPAPFIVGQGGTTGGGAYLIDDAGSGSFKMDLHETGVGVPEVVGQGAGELGTGYLEEDGAHASYVADLEHDIRNQLTVTASCGCNADAALDYRLTQDQLYVQGSGLVQGSGVLWTQGATQTSYDATLDNPVSVVLDDQSAASHLPPSLVLTGVSAPAIEAQGAGVGGGVGLLSDTGGTDSYNVVDRWSTDARALSADPSAMPMALAESQPTSSGLVVVQGAGAYLLDLGGQSASFSSLVSSPVTTFPTEDGAFEPFADWPSTQGAAGGTLVSLAASSQVIESPSVPTGTPSPDPHGYGAWCQCGYRSANGEGYAPGASGAAPILRVEAPPTGSVVISGAVGSAPQLRLTDPRVDVSAALQGSTGQPVAGAAIHFLLALPQTVAIGSVSQEDGDLIPLWISDAVTDSSGRATASLPALDYACSVASGCGNYVVMATYDGQASQPGIYPMHATATTMLTPIPPPAETPEVPVTALLGVTGAFVALVSGTGRRLRDQRRR